MNDFFEKLKDLFMFREGTEAEEKSLVPVITAGSVVWGMLLRTFTIVFITFIFMLDWENRQYWWFCLFAIWLFAIYPGYRQYQKFQQRSKRVEEETLCGACKYFESSSQLCKIYDEHITKDYIPCEGLSWEPKETF